MSKRIAVIGGGMAGCAAAIFARREGHEVTLFEASSTLGGRAKTLARPIKIQSILPPFQGEGKVGVGVGKSNKESYTYTHPHPNLPSERGKEWLALDQGQHVAIGAYKEWLALLRFLEVDIEQAFYRLPLNLRDLQGHGLALSPRLSWPWNVLFAPWQARGFNLSTRLSLLHHVFTWWRHGFGLAKDVSMAELCRAMPTELIECFIEPLCLAALNTPIASASARVFLRVLHDALFGGASSSDILIPRTSLQNCCFGPAMQWFERHGVNVHLKTSIDSIQPSPTNHWQVAEQPFDVVVIATSPTAAIRLLEKQVDFNIQAWVEVARRLRFESITTTYIWAPDMYLPQALVRLRSSVHAPAQFVIDHGRVIGINGLLDFVVSASHGDVQQLESQIIAQARELSANSTVTALKTITEKRATFACTVGIVRPSQHIAPNLFACGDYVDNPAALYPATLEGAVRSSLAISFLD